MLWMPTKTPTQIKLLLNEEKVRASSKHALRPLFKVMSGPEARISLTPHSLVANFRLLVIGQIHVNTKAN